MLLANKSVTGKRKLIDNWKPSSNTLHIYRIRVLGWARRCVHRNLLLQINFLPLADTLECAHTDLSCTLQRQRLRRLLPVPSGVEVSGMVTIMLLGSILYLPLMLLLLY